MSIQACRGSCPLPIDIGFMQCSGSSAIQQTSALPLAACLHSSLHTCPNQLQTRSWPFLSYRQQLPKPHVQARPHFAELSNSVHQILQIPCKILSEGMWGLHAAWRGRVGMLSVMAIRKPFASLSMCSLHPTCGHAVADPSLYQAGKFLSRVSSKLIAISSNGNVATAVTFEERCFEEQAGLCHTVWMIAITASKGQALRTRVMDVSRNA